MMPKASVAYLGPEGTFAHLVARKRFGTRYELVPRHPIREVFDYVRADSSRLGVVPIENSSGGTIFDTVDCLLEDNGLQVCEALSVDVKLALMSKERENIRVIYSHFAPLHHCEAWLDDNYPDAELRETPSTGAALARAAEETGAAAIGNRQAGQRYHLRILEYPLESSVLNQTQFFVVGHRSLVERHATRTSLIVSLPNRPGSLSDFLLPFKQHGVNLSRIISRPVQGKPSSYIFMIDIDGTEKQPQVRTALADARRSQADIRIIGSYPVRKRPYSS